MLTAIIVSLFVILIYQICLHIQVKKIKKVKEAPKPRAFVSAAAPEDCQVRRWGRQ